MSLILRFLAANPWKRMVPSLRKRDLLETLANDDPSAFGYDKRKRFVGDEEEEEDDFEEVGGNQFT